MITRQILIILSLTLLVSCTQRKSSDSNDITSAEVDSLPINEVKEIEILPDTIYPSVASVSYKVDVFDHDLDSAVNSLEDLYVGTPGAFTFRRGMHRNADFGGKVSGHPSEIVVDWEFRTDFRGTWGGGSGWTGQPLYVEWPDSMLRRFKTKGLVKADFSGKEILVGSLCGKVYFIDFVSGKASREAIEVNNPIKGTMSLDPTLNGNLYVGQGVPDKQPFGALVIDLNKNLVTETFGVDPRAWRRWGAYDSSPLRLGQYLFRPGENGTLYKFYVMDGALKLQSTLRYSVKGITPGIESSMAIYHNYGYVGDNHGNILCVNLNNMTPVWHYSLGDDIDSSIVLTEEGGVPYIYTGCEVDKQHDGDARFVKLNALNGEKVWQLNQHAVQYISGEKHFDGGFYSSALPGIGNCDSLLFANCVINENHSQNGRMLAINRYTGDIAYTVKTKAYAWSSPVGFVNENNEMFVVTGDCNGNIYLIDGKSGEIIFTKLIGNNFESSPVVSGNHLVVGSRGQSIFKMTVK